MKGTESKTGSLRIATGDDTKLTFKDYVQYYNYPFEEHKITTADGYILTYFRIQRKGQSGMHSGLPVMYLQHGLIDSADAWVVNS
jgi:gastric triacylglycerol lipase